MKFRPVAVPLVTVDPFFSIWSCADSLYGDCTRNWTEIPNPIMAGVTINNIFYSFGATAEDFSPVRRTVYQSSLTVKPLSTEYVFENNEIKARLTFTTPLLLDRLDILTRPVSYIAYDIERKCDDSKVIDLFLELVRVVVHAIKRKQFYLAKQIIRCIAEIPLNLRLLNRLILI